MQRLQVCVRCRYNAGMPRPPDPGHEPPGPVPDEECGLRERKKRATRRTIHEAALALAVQGGLDAVTVEAVAERAGVSPRTFFNYYPTRDDALVGTNPEAPQEIAAAVQARPADEPVREVVRAVMLARLARLAEDPAMWAARRRLATSDPRLGERMLGAGVRIDRAVVDAVVERARLSSAGEFSAGAELEVAVEAFAALGAVRAALREHVASGLRVPIRDPIDRAFAILASLQDAGSGSPRPALPAEPIGRVGPARGNGT